MRCLPPVTQGFISSFGWREAYIGLGVMVWVLLIPAAVFVVRSRPEMIGLYPDGSPEPVEEPGAEESSAQTAGRRRVVTSLNFWLLALPLAAVPFVVTALVFHQISILGQQGLEAGVAAAVFVVFAAASAVTTAFSGVLIEKLGPRKPLGISLGLLFLGVISLQLVTTPLLAAVYAAVLGAAAGMQGVVNGVIWAHYYGRRGLGAVQGPATMVAISAAALAPLPLAALQQPSGSYALGLILMAAIPLACAVMAYLFDPKRFNREVEST